MKDSRKGKGDGEKELSMPNPHMDGGKSERAIVYNTKEGKKEGEREKKIRKKKKKKKNKKNCVLTSDNTKSYPRIPFVLIQTYNSFLLTL